MFNPYQERASGESQEKKADVSDLITTKYEELQKARLMKMNLDKEISATPSSASEEKIREQKMLELVIPQLEQEFEDMKKSRAEELEKKFGTRAANEPTMNAPLVEGSDDDYLTKRLEGDERKAA